MKQFTLLGTIIIPLLLITACSGGNDVEPFLGDACTPQNYIEICTDRGECQYKSPESTSGICVLKRHCTTKNDCNYSRTCNAVNDGTYLCGNADSTTPFNITTETLANGITGAYYSQTLSVQGSDGAYRFEGTDLPQGLTLSKEGILSGIPTTAALYDNIAITAYNHNKTDSPLYNIPKVTKIFILTITPDYIDPCADTNPCTAENRTICTDDNNDGTAECLCITDFHLEGENCITNSRSVKCDPAPENGTLSSDYVDGNITQTWNSETKQYEPATDSCTFSCNETYHINGQKCDPATRIVPCMNTLVEKSSWSTENSNGVLNQTWNDDDQQYEPTANNCLWVCDKGHHQNESKDQCIENIRTEICKNSDSIPNIAISAIEETLIYNALEDAFSIAQTWSIDHWTPSDDPCNWRCPTGFVKDEGNATCIESPGELFISEYARGNNENKYIELYNPTDTEIDLTRYKIWKIANDGEWFENELQLSGTLPGKTAYLIINSSSDVDQALKNAASLTWAEINFNGDDPIALAKNINSLWTPIDLIGKPYIENSENDPGAGWSVAGIEDATASTTIVRKDLIKMGNIDWITSAGTTPENSEWIVLSQDTFTSAGSHPYDPTEICGNGFKTTFEGCDDNNTEDGDGCSSDCKLETGWRCPTEGIPCICAEEFHPEALLCVANNRHIPCENNLPAEYATWDESNSDGTINQIWNDTTETYEPAANSCSWSCDEGYIFDQDNTACIVDIKPLVINEVNIETNQIELKNNSDQEIPLDGHSLTIGVGTYPLLGVISANSYLVVDEANLGLILETDSVILKNGETILDQQSWADMILPQNYTLARIPDGVGLFKIQPKSTLNEINIDFAIDCKLLTTTLNIDNNIETTSIDIDLSIPFLTDITQNGNDLFSFMTVEIGYGLEEGFPETWQWNKASSAIPWSVVDTNHDHYAATITPSVSTSTQLRYTYRITINNTPYYCDGDGGLEFTLEQAGTLNVTVTGPITSDLMITEYVEGSGSNKCIELFNGTGSTVNLMQYSIQRTNKGVITENNTRYQLPDTELNNGETYLICNSATDNATILSLNPLLTNTDALLFNGDDDLILLKNDIEIDTIGDRSGTDWGKDTIFIRHSNIDAPISTYDDTQWDSKAYDDPDPFVTLGNHTLE